MKFGKHLSLTRVNFELTALWLWWTQTLIQLILDLLRSVIPSLHIKTTVMLDKNGGLVFMRRQGKTEPLFKFNKTANGDWPTSLRKFGPIELAAGTRAAFGLSDDYVLTRDLKFPDAVEPHLASAVRLYLEQESPLHPETVLVTQKIVERDRTQRQMLVRVRIVRRELVHRMAILANQWGLRLAQVGYASEQSRFDGIFLVSKAQSERRSLSRFNKALLVFLTTIVVFSVSWFVGESIYARYQARTQINKIKVAAQLAKNNAYTLGQLMTPGNILSGIMQQPDAGNTLDWLTERTPADTWAYEISIKSTPLLETSVTMSVFTTPAMDYAMTLEKSAEFFKVALVSSEDYPANPSLRRAKLTAVVEAISVNVAESP